MTEQIANSKASIYEHLRELRKRLIYIISIWLVSFLICYSFTKDIYAFLVQPLAAVLGSDARLIYTSLTETFFTYIKLALYSSFFLAFPFIAAQFYMFLAPGMYKNEKKALLPYLIAAPILFIIGAALAYYVLMPLAWQFLSSFETSNSAMGLPIELETKVSDYLKISLQIITAFGLSFQMPIALTLLAHAGIVKAATLGKSRKYAVIILITAAAILTPPDIISQVALFIPLYALYEISLISCKMVEKRKSDE